MSFIFNVVLLVHIRKRELQRINPKFREAVFKHFLVSFEPTSKSIKNSVSQNRKFIRSCQICSFSWKHRKETIFAFIMRKKSVWHWCIMNIQRRRNKIFIERKCETIKPQYNIKEKLFEFFSQTNNINIHAVYWNSRFLLNYM